MRITISEFKNTIGHAKDKSSIKQMDAFAESILKDTVPLASGEEGMIDLKIIEAIVRSADTGNKVKLIWSFVQRCLSF